MPNVSTKKRVRLNPAEREEQITSAAIAFAAERGLNFSTREFADYCGVSQSLLYRYFSSKEKIVERIYETVYLGRWDPTWEDVLLDRSKPVEERLVMYLRSYCKVVLRKDWVRIYLLSSFEEPMIAQKYTTLLRRRIFQPLLQELLHEEGRSPLRTEDAEEMAYDLIWSFHSSFFYIGIRTWVYEIQHALDMDRTVADRTAMFLSGFRLFLAKHSDEIAKS